MAMNPQRQEALQRVVLAAKKVMYDPNVFQTFKQALLKRGTPSPDDLAAQAVGLLKILMNKSNNAIPTDILIPAATMILLEMADFLVKSGAHEPTKAEMDAAMQRVVILVVRVFGGGKGTQPAAAPGAPPQAQGGMIAQQPQPQPMGV